MSRRYTDSTHKMNTGATPLLIFYQSNKAALVWQLKEVALVLCMFLAINLWKQLWEILNRFINPCYRGC